MLSLLFLSWQKYCVDFDYTCVQKDILSSSNDFARFIENAFRTTAGLTGQYRLLKKQGKYFFPVKIKLIGGFLS